MEHRSGSQFLLSFALLYVFCSQTLAIPSLGTYSPTRNDEQMPVKRHSDVVFTDNYSRFRKRMAVKKYLESILSGKTRPKGVNPPILQDETELLDPAFSEYSDDVTVEEREELSFPLNL